MPLAWGFEGMAAADRLKRNGTMQAEIAALKAANEALEAAIRARSLFFASIAHDLRTPLNAIIGFADLIIEETFGPIAPPRYREYIGDIKSSGEVLLALLNNLLDLSRLEAGGREMAPCPLDGVKLAGECLHMIQNAARQKCIDLALVAPEPVRLYADELAAHEILLNLLSNAIKFTPAQGKVSLAMGSDGEGVRISVRDTGIGMDESAIGLALKPYGQVANRHGAGAAGGLTTKPGEGTGLGLTITKRLIELHGGCLSIESALGRGTTVSIWLPSEPASGVAETG